MKPRGPSGVLAAYRINTRTHTNPHEPTRTHTNTPAPPTNPPTPREGHSIGNLILRAALTQPEFAPYKEMLWLYISVCGPHLGFLYGSNAVVDTGLLLLKSIGKGEKEGGGRPAEGCIGCVGKGRVRAARPAALAVGKGGAG